MTLEKQGRERPQGIGHDEQQPEQNDIAHPFGQTDQFQWVTSFHPLRPEFEPLPVRKRWQGDRRAAPAVRPNATSMPAIQLLNLRDNRPLPTLKHQALTHV
ncbi:hypothetical protein [Pseudomonas sp. P1.8]|uniref:hypothetical protein n=1 Tax=Pseudomonas sp. P1.8 TaxID=1699310 RepID=UPI00210E79DA|nr:hypothetical protein [Pseudomonas sp. P1.8]